MHQSWEDSCQNVRMTGSTHVNNYTGCLVMFKSTLFLKVNFFISSAWLLKFDNSPCIKNTFRTEDIWGCFIRVQFLNFLYHWCDYCLIRKIFWSKFFLMLVSWNLFLNLIIPFDFFLIFKQIFIILNLFGFFILKYLRRDKFLHFPKLFKSF